MNNLKRLPFYRTGRAGNSNHQKSSSTATFYANATDALVYTEPTVPVISRTVLPLSGTKSNLLQVPGFESFPSMKQQFSSKNEKLSGSSKCLSLSRNDVTSSPNIDVTRMSALQKIKSDFRSKSTSCLFASDVDDDDVEEKRRKNMFDKNHLTAPKIKVEKIRRKSNEVLESSKTTPNKKLMTHRRCHSAAILFSPDNPDTADFFKLAGIDKNGDIFRSAEAFVPHTSALAVSSKSKSNTFPRQTSNASTQASNVSSLRTTPSSSMLQLTFKKKLMKTVSSPVKHFLDHATLRYLKSANDG